MDQQLAVRLVIRLSWPEPVLWINNKAGHKAKAEAAARARDYGYIATLDALGLADFPRPERGQTIRLRVTGHRPADHGQDRDGLNTALKHYYDGIALALRVNDKHFKHEVDWGPDDPPHGSVTVEVYT